VLRISSPLLVAWATALVGPTGMVSLPSPGTAAHSRPGRALLPPGWPAAAGTVALVFGLAQLAVALVLARGVTRLTGAPELGEALGALATLAAPALALREFVAPPGPWACGGQELASP
jgi:hypothetical protein